MQHFCYSPLPIQEYRLTSIDNCEVARIMELEPEQSAAVWNLFWLSLPAVDALPIYGKQDDWYRHYQPTQGCHKAIVTDALADEALFRKLLMHPKSFIDFFHREDPWPYECFQTLGGEAWVKLVLSRAELAAKRLQDEETASWTGMNNVINMFRKSSA